MRTTDSLLGRAIRGAFEGTKKHFTVEYGTSEDVVCADDLEIASSFHPVASVMLEADDDYFCGLRANHFVVCYGRCEVNDSPWISITANHKGQCFTKFFSVDNGLVRCTDFFE